MSLNRLQIRRLLGIAVTVVALAVPVAAQTTSESDTSHYGRIAMGSGAPIDITQDSTTFYETDWASTYPGLEVKRASRVDFGQWRFKADERIAHYPSASGYTVRMKAIDREINFHANNSANDISRGIFETFRRESTASRAAFIVKDPSSDTETRFEFRAAINPVGTAPNYDEYRIRSERLRDGSMIYYDFDDGTRCSKATVRHQNSGVSYRIHRREITWLQALPICVTDVIELPGAQKIIYSLARLTQGTGALAVKIVAVNLPGALGDIVRQYKGPACVTQTFSTALAMFVNNNTFDTSCPFASGMRILEVVDEEQWSVANYRYEAAGAGRPLYAAGGSNGKHRPMTVVYNADGSKSVTDGDAVTRKFTFATVAGSKRLASISSPCEWCAVPYKSIQYYDYGLVKQTTDFKGVVTSITRYETDPRRREMTVVVGVGTPEAKTTTTEWHPTFNLPTKITVSARGGTYSNSYIYDGQGRETSRTFSQVAAGQNISRTTTTSYVNFANSNVANTVTVRGPRTDIVDETIKSYDTSGRLISVKVFPSALFPLLTTYGDYDANGRAQTVATKANFGSNGLPASTVTSRFTYDWRGNVLTSNVNGLTSTNIYYKNGLLKRSTTPGASAEWLEHSYDDAGRRTMTSDNLNNVTVYEYDPVGRTRQELVRTGGYGGPIVNSVRSTFSNAGRKVATSGSLISGTTTYATLDDSFRLYTSASPAGRVTEVFRDAHGTVTDFVHPSGVVQTLDHDVAGNVSQSQYWPSLLTATTDPSRRTFGYGRDAEGKQLFSSNEDSATDNFALDASGNAVRSSNTAGAPTWRTTYDGLGRPKRQAVLGAGDVELGNLQMTYDYNAGHQSELYAVGKVTGITGTFGTINYVYGSTGQLDAVQRLRPGVHWSDTQYAYDAAGRVTSVYYPSGRQVDVTRDALGRPNAISATEYEEGPKFNVASGIQYYPFGGAAHALSFAGVLPSTMKRDTLDRVTSYSFGSNSFSVSRNYDGTVKDIVRSAPQTVTGPPAWCPPHAGSCAPTTSTSIVAATVQSYVYDATTGHLSSASDYGVSRGYTHDGYGNMTSGPSGNFVSHPFTNKLTSRAYGAGGKVTSDGYNTITYDIRGNLESVSNSSGTWTYKYDADGARASKSHNGYTIYYHYDLAGHLIGESDSAGAWLKEYIWLEERPLMVIVPATATTSEARYHVHTDHANTPIALTNTSGEIVWEWNRGPYGEGAPTTTVAGLVFNMRMLGQYFDAESGYFYNKARYYDPRSGRFLQPDPKGEAGGGAAMYAYTSGDPINRVDPTGQFILMAANASKPLWSLAAARTAGYLGAVSGGVSGFVSTGGDVKGASIGAFTGGLFGFGNPVWGATWVGSAFNAGASNTLFQVISHALGFRSEPVDFGQTVAAMAGNVGIGRIGGSFLATPALKGEAMSINRGFFGGFFQFGYKGILGDSIPNAWDQPFGGSMNSPWTSGDGSFTGSTLDLFSREQAPGSSRGGCGIHGGPGWLSGLTSKTGC